MTHPQNSPRGLHSKKKYEVGAEGVIFTDYHATNALLDANSTGLLIPAQIRIGGARYINANSTGFVVTAEAAIPTTDEGAAFTIISNSTGVAMAVNSTGTTWKYLNVTSVQPT